MLADGNDTDRRRHRSSSGRHKLNVVEVLCRAGSGRALKRQYEINVADCHPLN